MHNNSYLFKNSFTSALMIFLRYFLVSMIPFITNLTRLTGENGVFVKTALTSLAILTAVLAVSVLTARSYKLNVIMNEGKVCMLKADKGIIFKSELHYHINDISCICRSDTLMTVLFGTVTLDIIPIHKSNRAVYRIRLSGKAEKKFLKLFDEWNTKIKKDSRNYKTGAGQALIHSAAASDTIGGLFFIVPIINYIGRLFGQKITAQLLESADSIAHRTLYFMPYAFSLAAVIITFGWTVSFIYNFLRSCNTASVMADSTLIKHGLLLKKRIYAPNNCMSGMMIKMYLICVPLGLYDVYAILPHITKNEHRLFAGIYRTKNRRLPPFFAPDKKSDKHNADTDEKAITNGANNKNSDDAVKFRPFRHMWYKFILKPLLMLFTLTAVLLPFYIDNADDLLFFLLPMLPFILLNVHWLIIQIINYKLCYLSVEQGMYKAVCAKGRNIVYTCIPKNKASLVITQSIFQRHDGSCNVKIVLPNKGNIFKICNLNYAKLLTISTEFST